MAEREQPRTTEPRQAVDRLTEEASLAVAKAQAEALANPATEVKPGGHYITADGRHVDANGNELKGSKAAAEEDK